MESSDLKRLIEVELDSFLEKRELEITQLLNKLVHQQSDNWSERASALMKDFSLPYASLGHGTHRTVTYREDFVTGKPFDPVMVRHEAEFPVEPELAAQTANRVLDDGLDKLSRFDKGLRVSSSALRSWSRFDPNSADENEEAAEWLFSITEEFVYHWNQAAEAFNSELGDFVSGEINRRAAEHSRLSGPLEAARRKRSEGAQKAYDFLSAKLGEQVPFTIRELADACDWKESTPAKYLNMFWSELVERDGDRYRVLPRFEEISREQFLRHSSQSKQLPQRESTTGNGHPLARSNCQPRAGLEFLLGEQKYTLAGKIGDGVTGLVRRATAADGRDYAVKFLAPDAAYIQIEKFQDVCRRFKREGERAAALAHPALVSVIGYSENRDGRAFITEDGPKNPFVVMERLSKKTLTSYIKKRQTNGDFVTDRGSLIAALQLVDSVSYLHSLSLVHRDIKPDNVFLENSVRPPEAPRLKLGDFGIVKWGDFQSSVTTGLLTLTGQEGLGTLTYMAPEQATDPKRVDNKSDSYALGATLFELFTGKSGRSVHHSTQVSMAHSSSVGLPAKAKTCGVSVNSKDLPIFGHVLSLHSVDQDDRPAADETLALLEQRFLAEYSSDWREEIWGTAT